ncbi:MAG: YdcF family protein [Mycobacteriales bacterium]
MTPSGDCLVVLGTKVLRDGRPSRRLRERLDLALRLHGTAAIAPIIVTGAAVTREVPEGESGRRYLMSAGVPDDDIIAETRARTTPDNALYTAEIAQRLGLSHPIIVTSRSHRRRSEEIFRHYFDTVAMATPKLTPVSLLRDIPAHLFEWRLRARRRRGPDPRLERRPAS